MKRFITFLAIILMSSPLWAQQQVFTVAFATSDDGFLNVRSQPSNNGAILAELPMCFHGLGTGLLVERGKNWSKVKVGNTVGWVYNKYLGTQNWINNTGKPKLVTIKDNVKIYGEDFADSGKLPVLFTVGKDVIIADDYTENGAYYQLWTAHDCLFIRKKDVKRE